MNFETPENHTEILNPELVILCPGETHVTESLTGEKISQELGLKNRVITYGEGSAMTLEEYNNYFFIDGVHVDESMRGQGIGTKFYEQALALARQEGKIGLISAKSKRNDLSNHIWKHFESEGKTGEVEIEGDVYDLIMV